MYHIGKANSDIGKNVDERSPILPTNNQSVVRIPTITSPRRSSRNFIQTIRNVWTLTWAKDDTRFNFRLKINVLMFVVERILFITVPWLTGQIYRNFEHKHTTKPTIAGLCVCLYIQILVKKLQEQNCLFIEQGSEKQTSRTIAQIAFNSPWRWEYWGSTRWQVEFIKGSSLIKCLEKVVLIWIPVWCNILVTVINLWQQHGWLYGIAIAIVGVAYLAVGIWVAFKSIPLTRGVVDKKRERSVGVKDLFDDIRKIATEGPGPRLDRWDGVQSQYQDEQMTVEGFLFRRRILPDMLFFICFGFVTTFGLGHRQSASQEFSSLSAYLIQLVSSLRSFNDSMEDFVKDYLNSEKMLDVVEEDRISKGLSPV